MVKLLISVMKLYPRWRICSRQQRCYICCSIWYVWRPLHKLCCRLHNVVNCHKCTDLFSAAITFPMQSIVRCNHFVFPLQLICVSAAISCRIHEFSASAFCDQFSAMRSNYRNRFSPINETRFWNRSEIPAIRQPWFASVNCVFPCHSSSFTSTPHTPAVLPHLPSISTSTNCNVCTQSTYAFV